MLIIWWIRRDIRLEDNSALLRAVADSGGAVLPCYVLDDAILRSPNTGAARLHFLLESLRELGTALRARGSLLLLRRGDPTQVLATLAAEAGAAAVYWNRDHSPYAYRRDKRVAEALGVAGVRTQDFKDVVIWEPGEITNEQGRPYSVYSPYARRWWARIERDEQQAPEGLPPLFRTPEQLSNMALPALEELGFTLTQQVQQGGEQAALRLLRQFGDLAREQAIGSYDHLRDFPALPATSRLSPHLHLGTIAPRRCLALALEAYRLAAGEARQAGPRAWIGELIWRDFYTQILAHHPHVLTGAFRDEYNKVAWENGAVLLEAWKQGRTGYPIVDAGMRQLNTEGWMHNRLRMITASFLTKDLLIDWRLGAGYFMQQLTCGNLAANNGGWQWAAGTGTDAQPFFRIFNPTTQGQKFDPDGAFVRRYLPELTNVPAKLIHEPWRLSPADQQRFGVVIGRDYPAPVVDHKIQRERALALYRVAKPAAKQP